MKRLLCLLLVLSFVLLCGCVRTGQAENEREKDDRDDLEEEKPGVDNSQLQLLYDYVANTLSAEQGLAALGPVTWIHDERPGGVEENWKVLQDNGCFGIVAAVVRDFDFDGSQDLVTFRLNAMSTSETWPQVYGRYTNSHSWVIAMDLYMIENGQVIHKDTVPCMDLIADDTIYGGLYVYLEKMEDGIYIDAHSSSTNYTTEGASPRTVYHVVDGTFSFDYVSGIRWGQGSLDENPNNVLGTANMDVDEYTICAHRGANDEVRNVLWLVFSLDDTADGQVTCTCTDFTQLRTILEQGVDAVEIPELPQGGLKPEDPDVVATRSYAAEFMDHVVAATGCVVVNELVSTYNGTVQYRYETEGYSFFSVSILADSGKIVRAGVSNNKYPLPGEWYDIKDAIIDYQGLGLSRSELEIFYGKNVSLNAYASGVDIDDANVAIRQISTTEFIIDFYDT